MKVLFLLIASLALAGCQTAPVSAPAKVVVVDKDGKPVEPPPQVIVVREELYYSPNISWHIGVGWGHRYYRPYPWRYRHW